MADEETAKEALERLLYTKIDAGLYKRDAYEIANAIEALIHEKLAEAMDRISAKLEHLMPDKSNDI
jgi:hypothetical protein